MKKVSLTSNEFLSLYNGCVLGDNFSVVLKGLEKYFGYPVLTIDAMGKERIFRQEINKSRPDLVTVMNKLGKFVRNRNIDIDTQTNEYVKNFETLYGKNTVELVQYKTEELSM